MYIKQYVCVLKTHIVHNFCLLTSDNEKLCIITLRLGFQDAGPQAMVT